MSGLTVNFITTATREQAKSLAKLLVQKKLAACVNIIPSIESIYEWDGKLCEEQECLLMAKSQSNKTKDLVQFVKQNHSYDTPEVITLDIKDGNKDYLDWVQSQTNNE